MSPLVTLTGVHIPSPHDALLVLEAARTGVLPRVHRRLGAAERAASVCAGAVIVFEEDESGMRRWTDGRNWSPSRVSGCFLVYREVRPRLHPCTAAPAGAGESGGSGEEDSPRGGPNLDFIPGGLVKRALSASTTHGHKLHLVSYHRRCPFAELNIPAHSAQSVRVDAADMVAVDDYGRILPAPSDLAQFANITIPHGIYPIAAGSYAPNTSSPSSSDMSSVAAAAAAATSARSHALIAPVPPMPHRPCQPRLMLMSSMIPSNGIAAASLPHVLDIPTDVAIGTVTPPSASASRPGSSSGPASMWVVRSTEDAQQIERLSASLQL